VDPTQLMGAANPGTTLTRSGRGTRQMERRGSRVGVGRSKGSGVGVGRGGWSGEGQGRWSVDVVVVAPRIVDLLAPHQTDENASVHHVHQLHTHGITITSISISILIAVIITTNFLCSLFTKIQLPLYICNSVQAERKDLEHTICQAFVGKLYFFGGISPPKKKYARSNRTTNFGE